MLKRLAIVPFVLALSGCALSFQGLRREPVRESRTVKGAYADLARCVKDKMESGEKTSGPRYDLLDRAPLHAEADLVAYEKAPSNPFQSAPGATLDVTYSQASPGTVQVQTRWVARGGELEKWSWIYLGECTTH